MGAWGPGSFENDGAHDWLAELDGIRTLRRTLERVARKAATYIDVDDATAVIAAAEVVAAVRGHATKDAPGAVVDWVAEHASKVTAADAALAKRAVVRVQKSSELQALWADHGAKNPWTHKVGELLERLTATPVARKAVKRTAQKRKTKAREIEVPEMRIANNPDNTLRASVTSTKGICVVVIEAEGGGGSVFAAMCDFDAVAIRWLDDARLEVTYPRSAKLIGERETNWYFSGRNVAVRYKNAS